MLHNVISPCYISLHFKISHKQIQGNSVMIPLRHVHKGHQFYNCSLSNTNILVGQNMRDIWLNLEVGYNKHFFVQYCSRDVFDHDS